MMQITLIEPEKVLKDKRYEYNVLAGISWPPSEGEAEPDIRVLMTIATYRMPSRSRNLIFLMDEEAKEVVARQQPHNVVSHDRLYGIPFVIRS